jgi:cytochrome P450
VRAVADLPQPPGLPLLGNAHQVRPSVLHSVAETWCETYGPIFRLKLGPRQIVCVGDLEAINGILRDRPGGFRRGRQLEEGLGFPGVFLAEGDEWRKQRRLVVVALNSNHLSRYYEIVRVSTERLHRKLKELTYFRQGFDPGRELTCYTVDIASALAFGSDLNTLERRSNVLQQHIQRVFQINGRRLSTPLPYWRWFNLPADRAAERSLAAIRQAVERFIEQARARMAAQPHLLEEPENFLESMLAAQQADGSFTDDEIIGNTFTLLLAGEDTTAHTLAWTMWLLASRPEIQERCAQEAVETYGERRFPDTYETVGRLRYAEAVLRESMRLKPVAPILGVEPLADTVIMDTRIPAGTQLLLLTRHASRHSGEFDDAGSFDPETWMIDGDGETPGRSQKAFLPFGAGPRFCPGRNLALLEAKSALSMITRNFELQCDAARGPVTERLAFTMIPEGLRLRIHERMES